MNGQRGKAIYAQIGAAAVLVVAVLVGVLYWDRIRPAGESNVPPKVAESEERTISDASKLVASPESRQPDLATTLPPEKEVASEQNAKPATDSSDKQAIATDAATSSASSAPSETSPADKAEKVVSPGFDLVRIEPSGENVIAGRGAPGATIEMMRNGEVYARTVADPSGLFALVAPALPVGPSQIFLQSIAPDGTHERSKENVTVLISNNRTKRPLVAMASPDKPTVILSNPDTPETRKPDTSAGEQVPDKPSGPNRPEVRIVSVEAAEGGRLFVSGLAVPGAAVRLYLNGTLVAPGGADSEGKLSFAIARGIIAGEYRVRLDDVDPVSGQVKSKAEVMFKMPGSNEEQTASGDSKTKQGSIQGYGQSASSVLVPSVETATVNRDDSLWRISQRTYGTGYRYIEIYDANQQKIRHPDLIFPGQVFVLPKLD